MSFWNQAGVEPKRAFRWLLYLSGMPQFIVTKVKKPGFTVGNTPYQFLNYEFKYPGRVVWSPINFTIVDPVSPDSTGSLYKILTNAGYVIPINYQEAAPATISKKGMVESLGTQIKLAQLNQDGAPIETWTMNNPLITSVDFGDLDYSNEGLVNIAVNLTYDWATVETNSGDGPAVGWTTETPGPAGNLSEGGFRGDNTGRSGFGS
ncbi:MAG TPA: hypothetical protein DCM40_20385 [Maribacter sp.]|nr:hypothetical protein [Maribacter sp.]